MGNCKSCESTQVATTAKVVLHDGRLEEFSSPVKASYVFTARNVNPKKFFICSADEMEFGGVVKGVYRDELLQLGQLYFALPLNVMKKALQPEEIAALAVKASSALNSRKKCGCTKNLVFPVDEQHTRNLSGGNRSRARKGSAGLCVIPELEYL